MLEAIVTRIANLKQLFACRLAVLHSAAAHTSQVLVRAFS